MEASSPELKSQEVPVPSEEASTSAATNPNELAIQELQRQLTSKDVEIASLKERLSTSKSQEVVPLTTTLTDRRNIDAKYPSIQIPYPQKTRR
jgi:hypothetical protein